MTHGDHYDPLQSAVMATKPSPLPYEQSLNDRVRQNIRLLKTFRQVSDATIAERAGYSSRQQVADRVGTRTTMSLDDIDRISAALEVDRLALLSPPEQMMAWVTQNPLPEPEPAPAPRRPDRKRSRATAK